MRSIFDPSQKAQPSVETSVLLKEVLFMKIHLQTIEGSVSETFYFQAEEILELGNFKGFQQIDRQLWIANIIDQGLWEAEVEMNGNFLKEASCECPAFSKKTNCSHVVALLLLIRASKEKYRLEKKAIPAPAPKPRVEKFTVVGLIDELSEDELRKFLKLYAKQNKDFSLALKARFAGQVGEQFGAEKYLQILEESRRSNRRVGKPFSIQGQRNYLRLAGELVSQADNAIKQVDFPQSSALLISLLTELPANLAFVQKSKKPLLKPIYLSFTLMEELLTYPLAPALSEELWQFFSQQLILQGPGSKYTQGPFLDGLMSLARDNYQKENLLKVVLDLLAIEGKETQRYEQLETTRIDLMVRLGGDPFEDHDITAQHPLLILKILENLEQRKDYSSMAQTLEHAFLLKLDPEVKAELEDYWLRYAKATRNEALIMKVSEIRIINSLDGKYIEDLRMTAPNWELYLPKLMGKLSVLPFSIAKRDLIGKIWREEEKPEELFDYLVEVGALDLFNKYMAWIFEYLPEKVTEIYPEIIKDYAAQHIGPIAAEKIGNALKRVKETMGRATARAIKDYLIEQYEPRASLMQSLQNSRL